MSKQSATILKSYFIKGSIPTQDNFAALIDSTFNLLDANVNIDAHQQIGLGCIPVATLSVQSQCNTPISGTVSTTNSSATLLGTNTQFTTEADVGTVLSIAGQLYTVTAVASDTSLSIAPPFPAAPTPVVSNSQALADARVLLSLANAAGRVGLQLDAGGTLQVADTVTAVQFSGSGAQLRDIPATAITGTFIAAQIPDVPASKVTGALLASQISGVLDAAQIPNLPASKINGQLAAAQIPSLFSREMLLYAAQPVIQKGSRATICWLADCNYDLTLVFQLNGQVCKLSNAQGVWGPGQYTVQIEQATLFTLTASKAGKFVVQRQCWIDVVQ